MQNEIESINLKKNLVDGQVSIVTMRAEINNYFKDAK